MITRKQIARFVRNTRGIAPFFRCHRGIAAVEFAVAMPLLLTMIYGVIETTRYILLTQKVEKLAHALADLTAQSQAVTATSLSQTIEASSHIMEPFTLGTNSRIIISSLYRPAGSTTSASVNWCHRGAGSLSVTSRIGALGTVPTMPGGFTFNERENIISAEVFYRFAPLITTQFFDSTTVYRAAFYKPRLGQLTTASGASCN